MKTNPKQVVHFLKHIGSDVTPKEFGEALDRAHKSQLYWLVGVTVFVLAAIVLGVDLIQLDKHSLRHFLCLTFGIAFLGAGAVAYWLLRANNLLDRLPENSRARKDAWIYIHERERMVVLFGNAAEPNENWVVPDLILQVVNVIEAAPKCDVYVDSAVRADTAVLYDSHKRRLNQMIECAQHFIEVPSSEALNARAKVVRLIVKPLQRETLLQTTD